jgi:class 3 adenylate cyclase/DNA-binding NarL/FixJ family response regulator
MPDGRIRVLLADDNLIVREGVRALLALQDDLEVVGTAGDYESLIEGAEREAPHVVVTDIRMPPAFQQEGVAAAKEVRKRNPGTGIVILSQYGEPEYAISLLGEGTAGYAYLLKDRVAHGDQLVRAIREVAIGGSMLDPAIVEALVTPVTATGELSDGEEDLLRMVAEGRSIKAIAAARSIPPAAAAESVEALFLAVARGASAGSGQSLRRLRLLHEAIVEREEQGETLSRFLPSGLAEKLRVEGRRLGEAETLEVTVLMSDVRGYSTIAEHADPRTLAGQLNEHRREMNAVVHGASGTVMQFVGDALMAVFGAPLPHDDHATVAVETARAMHARQAALNDHWEAEGLPPFGLGIGVSTGEVAAALLGSEDRLEYTLVGSTVNLADRLQQLAEPHEIVLSTPTYAALTKPIECVALEPATVKGHRDPVSAYRIPQAC